LLAKRGKKTEIYGGFLFNNIKEEVKPKSNTTRFKGTIQPNFFVYNTENNKQIISFLFTMLLNLHLGTFK